MHSGLELLPEDEAHGGGLGSVEQAAKQLAERAAGWRANGRFATIFHCGEGKTRKMEGMRGRFRRRDGQTKRPGPDIAWLCRREPWRVGKIRQSATG